MTKPFSLEELIARVGAVLRRTSPSGRGLGEARVRGLETRRGDPRGVPRGEPDRTHGRPSSSCSVPAAEPAPGASKSQILDYVWEYDFDGDANMVETYVSYLRKKIDTLGPPLIHTSVASGTACGPGRGQVAARCGGVGAVGRRLGDHRAMAPAVAAGAPLRRARGFVGIGLVVADVVIYREVQAYLTGQVDSELQTALPTVVGQLKTGGGPFNPNFDFGPDTPAGTWRRLGHPVGDPGRDPVGEPGGTAAGTPRELAHAGALVDGALLLGRHREGPDSFHYRVLPSRRSSTAHRATPSWRSPSPRSTTRSDSSMTIDLVVSAALLVVLAVLVLVVVRVGMRPLVEIERTAGAIAAGDMSRRVVPTDEHTEVGRLGASLNEMLAQIEQAFANQQASEQRLRQFLADASHELRTPLTSIRGYSELFRRGAADRPEDLSSAMRRIEDEATRMGALVDDLLLLARLDQGRPLERVPVDLAEVAREVTADAAVVDPGRAITLEASPPTVVLGDEPRLRQAVANLVRNALDHTPPGTPSRWRSGLRDHGRCSPSPTTAPG